MKVNRATFRVDAVLFDVVLFVVFLLFTVTSLHYSKTAKQFPLPVSVMGSIFVFLLLLCDLFPPIRKALPFVSHKGYGAVQASGAQTVVTNQGADETSVESGEHPLQPREWLRVLRIVLWLMVMIIVMPYIGYLATAGCSVFFLTWFEGRLKWWKSLLSAVVTVLVFYLIFSLFLQLR
ncbi:tripartite tricarboxylate transporter TctB family protein [Alicyclobacillus suci]|uniref:tripartite tricarboxylate transporter TctB family protein n=1 Tax=Alicyclobacillus suci TaxID=2816080 RepID=UPI001A8F7289|nr:tripartite tricarboxylate transporter TctB family protein [Alicyclobacillus suci]